MPRSRKDRGVGGRGAKLDLLCSCFRALRAAPVVYHALAMAPLQGFPWGKLAREARLMRGRATQICR